MGSFCHNNGVSIIKYCAVTLIIFDLLSILYFAGFVFYSISIVDHQAPLGSIPFTLYLLFMILAFLDAILCVFLIQSITKVARCQVWIKWGISKLFICVILTTIFLVLTFVEGDWAAWQVAVGIEIIGGISTIGMLLIVRRLVLQLQLHNSPDDSF